MQYNEQQNNKISQVYCMSIKLHWAKRKPLQHNIAFLYKVIHAMKSQIFLNIVMSVSNMKYASL